jgi:hypothetical protein
MYILWRAHSKKYMRGVSVAETGVSIANLGVSVDSTVVVVVVVLMLVLVAGAWQLKVPAGYVCASASRSGVPVRDCIAMDFCILSTQDDMANFILCLFYSLIKFPHKVICTDL